MPHSICPVLGYLSTRSQKVHRLKQALVSNFCRIRIAGGEYKLLPFGWTDGGIIVCEPSPRNSTKVDLSPEVNALRGPVIMAL
ncbi:hypothetical protein IMCC1933_31080 [Rhodobacteraceae bacterium IMCC1933]|nr:hypothetical protein [Rhodobacteraceae bacterium IMCC1933]